MNQDKLKWDDLKPVGKPKVKRINSKTVVITETVKLTKEAKQRLSSYKQN